MQKPANAFTLTRSSSIAIDLQRNVEKARRPDTRQQIFIYPQADATKRQRIAKTSI